MPSISFPTVLTIVLVAGVLLFGISSAILRSLDAKPKGSQWPKLIDESIEDADTGLRRDMIDRLGLVASPWSRGVLETALAEERDPQLRSLIERALSG